MKHGADIGGALTEIGALYIMSSLGVDPVLTGMLGVLAGVTDKTVSEWLLRREQSRLTKGYLQKMLKNIYDPTL